MNIRVHSIHFNADKKLLAFIQKKVNKLDQIFKGVINGEVYLKLQKAEDDANKIAVVRINIPGSSLLVKEQCKTFEEATDLAINSLLRQVNKYKAKGRNRLGVHKQLLSA